MNTNTRNCGAPIHFAEFVSAVESYQVWLPGLCKRQMKRVKEKALAFLKS